MIFFSCFLVTVLFKQQFEAKLFSALIFMLVLGRKIFQEADYHARREGVGCMD